MEADEEAERLEEEHLQRELEEMRVEERKKKEAEEARRCVEAEEAKKCKEAEMRRWEKEVEKGRSAELEAEKGKKWSMEESEEGGATKSSLMDRGSLWRMQVGQSCKECRRGGQKCFWPDASTCMKACHLCSGQKAPTHTSLSTTLNLNG